MKKEPAAIESIGQGGTDSDRKTTSETILYFRGTSYTPSFVPQEKSTRKTPEIQPSTYESGMDPA